MIPEASGAAIPCNATCTAERSRPQAYRDQEKERGVQGQALQAFHVSIRDRSCQAFAWVSRQSAAHLTTPPSATGHQHQDHEDQTQPLWRGDRRRGGGVRCAGRRTMAWCYRDNIEWSWGIHIRSGWPPCGTHPAGCSHRTKHGRRHVWRAGCCPSRCRGRRRRSAEVSAVAGASEMDLLHCMTSSPPRAPQDT